MLTYVVFGGMLATTWVQIIKAVLLMSATFLMSVLVLERVGFNPIELFNEAKAESPEGDAYLAPGLFLKSPIDTLSLGIAPGARDGRAAAHPDALLHRPRREGGALLRGLGGGADRRLLHHDHVPRVRRAGAARRRTARRRRARAATWRPRCSRRSSAAAPERSAATCSWRWSRRWPSPRSSPWSRASCSRRPLRCLTTCGRTSSVAARAPRARRSTSPASRPSRSARSRSSSRSWVERG